MDPSTRDALFPSAAVFCNPRFLSLFQTSPHRPFQDSKSLVDLELSRDPQQILQALSKFPSNPSQQQYTEFLNWCFASTDPDDASIVRPVTPTDANKNIPMRMLEFSKSHPHLASFALDLKLRWADLCRAFPSDMFPMSQVLKPPSLPRSSIIPLPHPFFIPGGRFRECYYWDTLWVVKGLIASDMVQSAQNAVRNLLYLVQIIGFVPNGNRVYYLNRSQPPTLTEAVLVVFDALPNNNERAKWLQEAVPILDQEYENFTKAHSIFSVHGSTRLAKEQFSIYTVNTSDPRPESFNEDLKTLQEKLRRMPNEPGISELEPIRNRLFQDLASGAESGWDYTSRFLTDNANDLRNIRTQNIVPCCLNSILFKAETDLANFHDYLGMTFTFTPDASIPDGQRDETVESHVLKRDRYRAIARERQAGVMKHMWSQEDRFWFDLDVTSSAHTSIVSSAGIMPAWAGCWEGFWTPADAAAFVDFVMNSSGLFRPGGLSSTATPSEQQWDFPNCWAPLVDFAVSGMQRIAMKYPESGAAQAAEEIAKRYLRVTYKGWKRDGSMHEKYDCRYNSGARGVGGEYVPQTGFGWTNGTALWLLREYADVISDSPDGSWTF